MAGGPLEGLQVIDLTDDTGRFATKLLCEQGASVVRMGGGSSGPAMANREVAGRGGVLDWWYDSGKPRLDLALETEEGHDAYRALATRADLVVETQPPGVLAGLGLDYSDVAPSNPRLVQVSLTPFGRTGPRAGWQTSDLVASALGGILSLSGLPEEPQSLWGRQAYTAAGFVAAVSGMAAVFAARRDGIGQHVDVALHEAVCTTVEQLFFQYWFDDLLPYPKIAPRQGSLHWTRAYKVVPAKTGWELITASPRAAPLLAWMLEEHFPPALEVAALAPHELIGNMDRVMDTVAAFAKTMDATTLFAEAQRRHIAFGEVQSVAQVAANPQHAFRGFFKEAAWEGPPVAIPGPIARFHGSPSAPLPPPGQTTSLDRVLDVWTGPRAAPGGDSSDKPLQGVRVLDLSHVLAGPMCTRMLGDLGADIVKVQTVERAVLVNDPGHPFFYAWNRSKRAVTLNMRHERAAEVVRGLIEKSDVLIENFSAGVLDRWGLSYRTVAEWNPALIYVTMSGCGHEGPWSGMVSYAPTIHALCGLTYLSNPSERGDVGPGFSFNDHVVGMTAALGILSALVRRTHDGAGQHIDISQLETGSYVIGPALIDFLNNGREARPAGNRDPFGDVVPNDCYRTRDAAWLAVSCRDDDDWRRLLAATGIDAPPALLQREFRREHVAEVDELLSRWAAGVDAEAGQALLQDAGVPAGRIQDAADLMVDPQLVARQMWHTFDHPGFGSRPFDRYPALFSRSSLEPYLRPAAYAGEGNFEVYPQLLDLDESAVADAMESGLFS